MAGQAEVVCTDGVSDVLVSGTFYSYVSIESPRYPILLAEKSYGDSLSGLLSESQTIINRLHLRLLVLMDRP